MSFIVTSVLLLGPSAWSGHSSIVETEGRACMGDDRSRNQTEDAALQDAKRRAVESASTYIRSETRMKNFEMEKDLLDSYARATVRIQKEIEKGWYQDPASGNCFRTKILAEVIPDNVAMQGITGFPEASDDPKIPLSVRVWTEKSAYRAGEKIRILLKGNKPFYARVLYADAGGEFLQLLPNPFRKEDYFNGGVVYEIPSGPDRFELEVGPPFGEERIVVYASTAPLGDVGLLEAAGVYKVTSSPSETTSRTRGVHLRAKGAGVGTETAEFFEGKIVITTGK